ncbi:MAG: hypothetical protein M1570_06560 [Chloroflexi bacterium]|nr:hypothetical protein [Chloroflexota bacterium]
MPVKKKYLWTIVLVLLAASILLAIGLSLALANHYLSTSESKYQEGAAFLNSIAHDLGRTSHSQISSRHMRSVPGALYSYDYIQIVFSTDQTDAQVAGQLDALQSALSQRGIWLQSRIPRGRDTNKVMLLQSSGLALTLDGLSFWPRASVGPEDWPFITRWNYRNSRSLAVMEVDLMESNSRGDKWEYESQPIDGNVVVLTLFLSYF